MAISIKQFLESVKTSKLNILFSVIAGFLLFCGTAAVIAWQNSRLTVLYDLCGVLENAFRMSQGDRPYLDFPFPYAPLTFLTQAAIIKLTGPVYWHHIVYCCVIAGLSTVITWRVLSTLLSDLIPTASFVAFLLSLPLVILGVYCIFPHPFYDPDSCFVILVCIFFVLWVEKRDFPSAPTFLLGAPFVIPLFIKQNIGLAFLGSTALALLVFIAINLWKKRPVRGYLLLIGGMLVGLAAALAIIQYTVGLENYKYWTITFATARRTPSFADMLSVYADWMLPIWIACFALGAILLRKNESQKKWLSMLSTILMSLPFIWPVAYLFMDPDASERAERLMSVWPFVMIVSFALTYVFVRRLSGIRAAIPFILISTAHGVFLSQQLWGSTYGIWPLLLILIGTIVLSLFGLTEDEPRLSAAVYGGVISLALIIAGGFYVYSNERLDYVDFEDGDMAHSQLPQLKGLSMRGSYLPDFEELVAYTDQNIPREAGILLLPGEDLFYYTTGRHPRFPVLLFDVTNNPLNADQILEQVRVRDIQWLIIKNDLQIEADKTIDDKDKIFEVLKPEFKHVESLNNYEIYKRKKPGEPDEEDDSDDNDDDSSDSGTDDQAN
jgi:hypothetical protein